MEEKEVNNEEAHYGSKIKVVTQNGQAAHLYDAQGNLQTATKANGAALEVFEVKKIGNKTFYRVGGQNEWLLKNDTNLGNHVKAENVTTTSTASKDNTNPSTSVKNGLALQQGSSIPDYKGMLKVFKNGKDFPSGTKLEWVFPPDTSQSKYTNAKIKVTFPDESSKERKVHYSITPSNKQKPKKPTAIPTTEPKLTPISNNQKTDKTISPRPDFDFDFMKNNEVLGNLIENANEVQKLYAQGFFDQMANTIRRGLEYFADRLLLLNNINPGEGWRTANLSNKLGYVAHLRLLPKRMMDICFSIKDFGNIGSHNNDTKFNQTSALTNLRQYHDLLTYLTNVYENESWPYANIQITDEQNKHPRWYMKPQVKIGLPTYKEYLNNKNNPNNSNNSMPSPNVQPTNLPPKIIIQQTPPTEPVKSKTGKGMKVLITCFAILAVVIVAGIGYEVYQMMGNKSNPAQSQVAQKQPSSLKERAAHLSVKQLIALSLIYADRNDDSKLDSNWQNIYDVVSNNNYNVGRFDSYTFGDATVTAQGNNHIYVFEKGVGLGYQDKGSQRLVSFFDADQSDPVRAYDYQMLEVVNSMSKVNKLAKKIVFTDESQN